MICPVQALESVRLSLTWRNLIWLEGLFMGGVVLAMIVLKRYYPDLHWYFPLLPLGLVAALPGLAWFINRGDDNL